MLAVVPVLPTLEHRADGGLWLLDWAQLPLAYVYDAYLPLISAAVAFSFALSFALYAASLRRGALLALHSRPPGERAEVQGRQR